jgi:hypothetical protein
MPLYREDYQAYGEDLLNTMQRAAREAVSADLSALQQRQHEITQREQRMQNQFVFAALDKAMPDWRTTNNDPEFLRFLAQTEELSGRQAHAMLIEAFQVAAVPRILAFFTAYRAAIGQAPAQAPAARQQPPARPQSPPQNIAAQIEKLYAEIRRFGRTPEREAREKYLHQLAHQGRR